MTPKKKMVFDFGGVVFRWRPVELLQRVLPQQATNAATAQQWVDVFFERYVGDWGEFDRGTLEVAELVRRIASRTGLAGHDVQRVLDAVPQALQPEPDTLALLQRLRAGGHALYYLSNMPAPYARHLQAAHACLGWFRDGVFSSQVHHNKPEAAIYHLAAERFGAAPQELVFLDDTLPNVHAAQALGWNALHFSNAAQAGAALLQHGWVA